MKEAPSQFKEYLWMEHIDKFDKNINLIYNELYKAEEDFITEEYEKYLEMIKNDPGL